MNSSLAQRDNQKVEHLPHPIVPLTELVENGAVEQFKIVGYLRQVSHLGQGSSRNVTELQVFSRRTPGIPFGKIDRYCDRLHDVAELLVRTAHPLESSGWLCKP